MNLSRPSVDPAGSTVVPALERAVRPVALLFLAYPLWWALGVQLPMWPLVAVPAALWLVLNRRSLVLPPGYGVLLLFLGWVLASGLMVGSVRYAASYGLRLALYAAVVVIAVLVWTTLDRGLPGRRVVTWLVTLWAAAILLAYPGILVNNLELTSPFEALLGAVGANDPFVVALTHPEFSEYDVLYGSPRPSPLFAYTNDWGAAVGILTPVAVHALVSARSLRERLLLGGLLLAAVPPVLVSLNRGAWITIGVAVAYVVLRRAATGDFRALAAVGGSAVVVAATILFTEPLRATLTARFEYGNTSTRATLYEASWHLALRSPLLGWGTPQSSEGLANSNDVSIGTHGQLWTLLVSQGLVGTAVFVLGLLVVWWHARPLDGRSPDVWLHATGLAVVVQTAFYEVLPVPLAVALLCLAVCETRRRAGPDTSAPRSLSPRTTTTRKAVAHHG